MTYRNERAIFFEKFVAKFVKEVDDLERFNRGMHNGDVVNLIWKKMTNPDLSQYITALKVQLQREPRYYKDVLQDIASQVPTLCVDTFRKTYSNSGCPTVGAHDEHGKLYTGTYPNKKWQSESVRTHWQEILDLNIR